MPETPLPRDPDQQVGQFEDASGNAAPAHEDAAGNLLVDIAAGGPVGGAKQTPTSAALAANTDQAFAFDPPVNHIYLKNNSSVAVNWETDATTTLGSDILQPGQGVALDVPCTNMHLQSTGTPTVNGAAAGNIVLRGWA